MSVRPLPGHVRWMCITNITLIMDGSKVRFFRKQRIWSQVRLARKVGVSQSMVSKIERRAFQPKAHISERFAKVLGVALEQLGDEGALHTPDARGNPVDWGQVRTQEGPHSPV